MEEKEYRVKDVINLTLDRMKQEGLYFATKDDTGYASGKDLYKLDDSGYVTKKTIDRIVEEVIEYMGDGAAFLVDAVNQWIEDGIAEGKIGYIDNLNMEFDDNAVVEGNLEIYNGIGKEDLGTDTEPKEEEISKEAEEVKLEKKTESKIVEEYETEEEIKTRLKEINKQLAYIRRRDAVSLAVGTEEEQSELYAERNKLNGKLRKLRNKKVDIKNMSEDEAEELKQKLLDKGIWDGKEDSLQSALQIYRAYHMNESKLTEGVSINTLKQELYNKALKVMQKPEFGFDGDAKDYLKISVEKDKSSSRGIIVKVYAELDYEALMTLAEELDTIIQKYDKDAYLDAVTTGILQTGLLVKGKITETYHVLGVKKDKQGNYLEEWIVAFDTEDECQRFRKEHEAEYQKQGYESLSIASDAEYNDNDGYKPDYNSTSSWEEGDSFEITDGENTVTIYKQGRKWRDSDGNGYMGYLSPRDIMSYFRGYRIVESKAEKKTLTEGVRQRLNERNEQSAGVIEQALNGITDQTSEQEAGIITKTSELFQSLSDRGYDVQVSFDNGESTSSISIGQQGANVLITITDAEQPLRAFASGNFEINDDSLKMIKSIMEVLK